MRSLFLHTAGLMLGPGHRPVTAVRGRSSSLPLLLLLAAVAGLSLLAGPLPAHAHPLGNFTVNRYARIEVYRDLVRVSYILDFAEIPSFKEMADIDKDNNGASADELQAWAGRLSSQLAGELSLSMDGVAVPLISRDETGSSAPGQSNLPILRFVAAYEAEVPRSLVSGHVIPIVFSDSNYAGRLGWREIVIAPSTGAILVAPPGYGDRSLQLRAYPSSSLSGAPDERSVELKWEVGSGSPATRLALIAGEARPTKRSGFAGLVGEDPAWETIVLSLLAAAGFGMIHALGPGHGKTVVAAYLVGSRGTPRHAVALGLTVTATHTATVYALGFVALVASHYIVPEHLYLSLGVLSGVLVAGFGLTLLYQRLFGPPAKAHGSHRHTPWSEAHSHGSYGHVSPAEDPGRPSAQQHLSWRGLFTLGVLGGMLPCPSAIIVMLAAISLGQVFFGMLLIVAFSAGLAGVLTSIGVTIVLGHRLAGRVGKGHERLSRTAVRFQRTALIGSPLIMVIVGVLLTIQAVEQAGSVLR